MTTLMLIDGNSLTYRAFFALPADMATASGQVTNAVFGFTSMLINLVRDHEPDRIAVAFDRPEPTFRHEMVDTYKANRDATPDVLVQQMGLVREVVDTLGITTVEIAGYEADDVIATLATRAAAEGMSALVVTGDRDCYQLVEDPDIKVLYNKRGVSDYALYDEAGILDRTGVRPDQYVHYAALRGDPSDNLPGVPGVGEKTAAKLITTYGGLDGIFDHVDDQTPKLRENLTQFESRARTNVDMMRLIRDVPLDVEIDDLRMDDADPEGVATLFGLLEFGSLLGRLSEAFGDRVGAVAGPERRVLAAEVTRADDVDPTVLEGLGGPERPAVVAVGWSGVPGRSEPAGLAVVVDAESGEIGWWTSAEITGDPGLSDWLGSAHVAGHDLKPLLVWLSGTGAGVPQPVLDTKIAAYLLDPADPRYGIGEVLGRYTDAELQDGSAETSGQLDFGADESVSIAEHIGSEALAVAALLDPIGEALEAQGLVALNRDVEVPLIAVLARMEHVGVGVDRTELESLAENLRAECDRLRAEIHADAGHEFNVNSTPQLRTVLFEELGLETQKKTKTGFSTDAATLEKLKGQHPIVEHLLAYREVEKLRGTYGEGLLAEVAPDGRIHATFNQTVARTGRLSSDAPNLHNIPVRSEEGRRFRRAFVPAEGFILCVADYNQIELRCIAHLADDPGLIEAFRSGTDVHSRTASAIFGVEPADVTIEQRSRAKMVSYGLAYGMEAYGLGQRLGIPTADAQEILDAFFVAFPAVHDYMDRTVAEARERGYTETLFGRRRRIPELSSPVHSVRQAGERQAMNAGIQGLAADIFKVALVRLDAALSERGGTSRIILQVHDEVICEVPPADRDEIGGVVTDVMAGAFDLVVPLEVNLSFGETWADAKG